MTGAAVANPRDERDRRNVRLFVIHLLIALGFLAAFVWAQVYR